LAVLLFPILASGTAHEQKHFINETVTALWQIADKAIPFVIQWARG